MDKVALDKIQSFLQSNPSLQGLEQEQLVSIFVEKGIVTAKELEEISAFYASQMDSGMGLQLQSNRKIDDVLKRGKNSNEILFKSNDGKNYNLNKTIQNKLNKLTQDLKKSEDSQGWIGSSWSWAKNTFNFGDSSNKVREAQKKEQELLKKFNLDNPNIGKVFQELTGVEFTPDNLEKFIKGEIKLKSEQALAGYDEGQEMASDMGGDILSGIGAMLVYSAAVAAAPVTGGASIAIGFGLATVAGGGIKCGIKASDKGYCTKKDFVTGAFSGALAPLTGGLGGAVGKSVAKATGIQAVKAMGKEGVKQGAKAASKSWLKTALINPAGYEYGIQVAGKEGLKMGWKGAAALGAEMATDGALGGAIDTAFRTGYEQVEENGELDWGVIGESALQGGIGGAALAPVIGGGMKATGKIGHKIGEKLHLTKGGKTVADEVAEEVTENINKTSTEQVSKQTTKKATGTITREAFEEKFATVMNKEQWQKVFDDFSLAYPDKDLSELYNLPVFKYINSNDRNVRFAMRNIIKNFDSIQNFPYEKYDKYLQKLDLMTLSNLKLNEGISFDMLDKYSKYFTEDNFRHIFSFLNLDNIKYLDKYIDEGKINSTNIVNLKKFNKSLDELITKIVPQNDEQGLFNAIITHKNCNEQYLKYIKTFEEYIDNTNILDVFNLSKIPSEKTLNNIPKELFGTVITKDSFLKLASSYGLDTPISEYGVNFSKVNWDEYRQYFINGKLRLTSDVIDMMANNVDKNVLDYLEKTWPTASHAGEEVPFASYITNKKLTDRDPLMVKLELFEQCCQKDMIEHAKGNPTVYKIFKEFKEGLEKTLLNPVDIIDVDKRTINKFLKNIGNNTNTDKKLTNLLTDQSARKEFEREIFAALPELKTLTKDNDFVDKLVKAVSNPDYKNLSDNAKFTIKLACIFSSLSPNEAYALMGKMNLSYKVKRMVVDLLDVEKNLNVSTRFNLLEQHLATLYNTNEKINLLNIFLQVKTGKGLDPAKKDLISKLQTTIERTGIPVFETILPKGKNLNKIPIQEYNGHEYQILDLTKIEGDLSKYGFAPGTTAENFSVNATFVRNLGEAETILLTSNPNYAGIPSSSKIGLGQNGTFEERTFGVVLSAVDKNDFLLASAKDTDIGHGAKSALNATSKIYGSTLSKLRPHELVKRNGLAERLKEKLSLSDSQYIELYKQIRDKKYYTQIKKIKIDGEEVSPKRLEEIITALQDIQKELVNTETYKGSHNETNLVRPEVNTDFIIAKVDDISEISEDWLAFARDNNKKFILLGKNQVNGTTKPRISYKSKLNEKQLAAYNKHIKDIKSDLEKSLIPEQLENANKILELLEDHVLRFEPRSYTACTLRITSSDISAIAQIPNLNMQRLEFLVKNLSDKEPQGIGHILNRIMKMSDNDFDTISKFLGDKKNDVGLLYSLSGIDIKNIDRIQYYISQLGYGNKTNSADFSTLFTQISSMPEEQWNRVISRDLLKRLSSETKYNLHHSLLTLADLDDKA